MEYVTKAIERSIKAGFKYSAESKRVTQHWFGMSTDEDISISQTLLEPQFWIYLGKAEGWKEGVKINGITPIESSRWFYNWHEFMNALAFGKTPDDFFKEILK